MVQTDRRLILGMEVRHTTGMGLDLVVKNLRQLRTGATLSEALLELGSVWNPAPSAGCC